MTEEKENELEEFFEGALGHRILRGTIDTKGQRTSGGVVVLNATAQLLA